MYILDFKIKIRWNPLPRGAENRFSLRTVLYFAVECVHENYVHKVMIEVYFEDEDFDFLDVQELLHKFSTAFRYAFGCVLITSFDRYLVQMDNEGNYAGFSDEL